MNTNESLSAGMPVTFNGQNSPDDDWYWYLGQHNTIAVIIGYDGFRKDYYYDLVAEYKVFRRHRFQPALPLHVFLMYMSKFERRKL